jgi:hypothetical protein
VIMVHPLQAMSRLGAEGHLRQSRWRLVARANPARIRRQWSFPFPSEVQFSCITTRSDPTGSAAPVKIRTHSPALSAGGGGPPAKLSPMMRKRAPTAHRNCARHSHPSPRRCDAARRSKAWIGSARTRPAASDQVNLLCSERQHVLGQQRQRPHRSQSCTDLAQSGQRAGD